MWDGTLRTNVFSVENAMKVSMETGDEEQNLNYPRGSRNNCPSKE